MCAIAPTAAAYAPHNHIPKLAPGTSALRTRCDAARHVYIYTHTPRLYTAEPRGAYIYAHTYAHIAKRCLNPPQATMFGAQRREGVVQFAHALHTATSTSAITATNNMCAASSAYQIPHYTCVLTSGALCIHMQAVCIQQTAQLLL